MVLNKLLNVLGFDMYDLDLAKNMALSFQMYLVIHQKLLQYSVSIALQLVRRFPAIEKRVQEHNFKWVTYYVYPC